MRTCSSCGDSHDFEVVAEGDMERTFDYGAAWEGLRLMCPACGAYQRTSYASVALVADPANGIPGYRICAVVGGGSGMVVRLAR